MKKTILFTIIVLFSAFGIAMAQDSSRIFVTTGAGLIKSPGAVGRVFHPSIAFNSGFELVNKHNWYLHGTLDFNTLKYNQQVKEDGSPYLFQNTSSSLIMVAANAGKNFPFNNKKWFASTYLGAGYLNLGEPRLISVHENIIRQKVVRKGGVFGKAGIRIAYKTKINFLQTIYFDGSWWTSPLKAQGSTLNGFSFFLGARMSMK